MLKIRSILKLGNSKAVTIPKAWITNAEDQTGRKIVALAMEVNGTITLKPIFEKENKLHTEPATQTF
jgi:antitoxin component of MazEF toxin-antitoxin module